ncbi:hypothetical protein ABZ802_36125, partial [Streptomyces sp. NPDC047737]|uniref:hypothetical protein n=1 Tax=Streptomyces sp. NPDC047737 TaxID=3155740 RepID=UPI00340E05E8
MAVQLRHHRIKSLGKHRERAVQLTPHPHPLRTLTREQEPGPTRAHSTHGHTTRATRRKRPQPLDQLLPRPAHYRSPMLEHRTRRHQRETDINRPNLGPHHLLQQ